MHVRTMCLLIAGLMIVALDLRAEEPGNEVRLSLTPAAVPIQLDQFRLVYSEREKRPGPAAPLFYRAVSELKFAWSQKERRTKLYDVYNAETFDPEAVRMALQPVQSALNNLKLAARSTEAGWNFPLAEEGFLMTVNEVQEARPLAVALALTARSQMEAGDFTAAAESLRAGFSLAAHLYESGFLIGSLVGVAVADLMFLEVERWMQQPDAPSLYWALLELQRYIVPDPSEQYETDFTNFLNYLIPFSADELSEPLSPANQQRLTELLAENLALLAGQNQTGGVLYANTLEEKQAVLALAMLRYYPAARQRLIEQGFSVEKIDSLPTIQVVALEIVIKKHNLLQRMLAAFALPYEQAHGLADLVDDLIDKDFNDPANNRGERYPAAVFTNNGLLLLQHSARIKRRLRELAACEAIRLYLGVHPGELPESLDQLNELSPAPWDPLTQEPFGYELQGNTATMQPQTEARPATTRVYILTAAGAN